MKKGSAVALSLLRAGSLLVILAVFAARPEPCSGSGCKPGSMSFMACFDSGYSCVAMMGPCVVRGGCPNGEVYCTVDNDRCDDGEAAGFCRVPLAR